MDLYRFFHPHHNPRLRQTPMRLQEVSELELAAKELLRALNRASVRIRSTQSNIPLDFIHSAMDATELSLEFLHSVVEICDEDSDETLKNLMKERANAPGWEAWCNLLAERLKSLKDQKSPVHVENLKDYPEEMSINKQKELPSNFDENPSIPEIIKMKVSA